MSEEIKEKNKFAVLLPLQQWITEFHLKANKALGQNFLLDLNITDKIVRLADLNENCEVLEIGPGIGGLTISLLKTPIKSLLVIEKDVRFNFLLEKILVIDNRLKIIFEDALKVHIPFHITHVVANLPYNISVLFIINVLTNPASIKAMTVLVQKEVGERFISKNNCKSYGRISILGQIFADIKIVYNLSYKVFTPPPKVQSVVLKFSLKNYHLLDFLDIYEDILRKAFSHRRKLLTSTLGASYTFLKPYLEKKRCENLSVEDVIFFGQLIYKFNN
jgi:16S rRNA (adenine1518-N6/adenine1519-N6)-dimethyltransferase